MSESPVRVSESPGRVVSPALRWAVGLLFIEAAAVAGVTIFFVYEDLTATASSVRDAVATTLYFGGLSVLIAALAWFLSRRRAWARGPAVVLELLLLPIGYVILDAGTPLVGVPAMLLGLACAGLLLTPSARAALGIR